jgi:hypothetical protein
MMVVVLSSPTTMVVVFFCFAATQVGREGDSPFSDEEEREE